ncbi:MAG: hypothetical protein E7294_05510 [Lachnospiraceae bacterium]|nr:hypothetical protein [Lachnospiraceae bacterium]
MEKMIECASCGASFEASLVRCPYCGTSDAEAAEKEYMDQLEDVRQEVEEDLKEADKAVSGSISKVVISFGIVVVAFLLLVFVKIIL